MQGGNVFPPALVCLQMLFYTYEIHSSLLSQNCVLGVQIEFENQAENTQRTFRKTLTLCPVIHYSSHTT